MSSLMTSRSTTISMLCFLFLSRGDLLGEIVERTVGPAADIARLAGVLQQLLVGALLAPHHRGHDLDAGGLGQGHHLVDDLVDGLLLDLLAALGAVGGAHRAQRRRR